MTPEIKFSVHEPDHHFHCYQWPANVTWSAYLVRRNFNFSNSMAENWSLFSNVNEIGVLSKVCLVERCAYLGKSGLLYIPELTQGRASEEESNTLKVLVRQCQTRSTCVLTELE